MKDSRKHIRKSLAFVLSCFLVVLGSCDKFEYNPYQTNNAERPEELNRQNLQKLLAMEAAGDDTVTILFTGDSQRFYSSLDALVDKTNSLPDVDFLVLAGDISDFGLLQEFLWVYQRLEKLHVPYFCVIGNHDHTSNGLEIYTAMFGPRNFSFRYKKHKFLFHDTNGREYGFNGKVPDLDWMQSQLNDPSASWFVGVSHVPPYNEDFDPELEIPYKSLIGAKPGYFLSLHGHLHHGGDSYYYDDHVRYIHSFAVDHNQCLLLKLIDGKILKETIYY